MATWKNGCEEPHEQNDRILQQDADEGAPDMVLEVLSPNPRIGTLDERITWFAQYGVRECWLLHQFERRLEVVSFADGAVLARVSFDEKTPIRSSVLPELTRSLDSILRWGG